MWLCVTQLHVVTLETPVRLPVLQSSRLHESCTYHVQRHPAYSKILTQREATGIRALMLASD